MAAYSIEQDAHLVDIIHERQRAIIEVGGNEPPEPTVQGLIDLAAAQGVELQLARGRLLARSAKPIRADLQEVLDQAAELIVGALQGRPILCSLCASPAITVCNVNAPMCGPHAEG